MLVRIGRVALLAVGCVVALCGLWALPVAVLITWVVLVMFVGAFVAVAEHTSRGDPTRFGTLRPGSAPLGSARLGAGVSAALLALGLVVAGLVMLLGALAALVVPLLLAVGATWVWRRRRSGPSPWSVPNSDAPDTAVAATCASPGDRRPRRDAPRPAPPIDDTNTVPAVVLRAAWQHTYWQLRDLPAGSPDRPAVVELRGRLLDEFERRDPDGFARWLSTEPRAGSDPGRHLSADH